MDFVDWRKAPDKQKLYTGIEEERAKHVRSRRFSDYVEEIIVRAQERGEFDNLPGMGKPLRLEDESATGDNAVAYHLLKRNQETRIVLPDVVDTLASKCIEIVNGASPRRLI